MKENKKLFKQVMHWHCAKCGRFATIEDTNGFMKKITCKNCNTGAWG